VELSNTYIGDYNVETLPSKINLINEASTIELNNNSSIFFTIEEERDGVVTVQHTLYAPLENGDIFNLPVYKKSTRK
jgi:hypothetical protein